jgi:hypothetical protein
MLNNHGDVMNYRPIKHMNNWDQVFNVMASEQNFIPLFHSQLRRDDLIVLLTPVINIAKILVDRKDILKQENIHIVLAGAHQAEAADYGY